MMMAQEKKARKDLRSSKALKIGRRRKLELGDDSLHNLFNTSCSLNRQ